ncbi:MAG: tetratricopeptide repeat protein, partial [Marinilabiliales bacterium]|nr:tetratricopeptide repeat protein [Marinilabiliales bacterium]
MKRLAVIPLLSLFLLWLTFGCTTQKNNVATRFYHELTSHYNLYFNANESMKEGILRVKRSMAEDFTRILPVFPEDNQVAMQSAAPQMELAVQKCLKLIASHSITVSPTRKSNDSEKYKEFASRGEYNNWIDDTYLLMGEANYYLHDLHKAVENFNFILHNFSTQPTRNPAFLWLARCYLVTGEQEKALEIFQLLERDGTLPEKVKRDLSLVKAGYFIGKEQWKEAIPQLKQALRYDMPSDDRGRYNFILAQLCRQTGDADGASEAFKRVIKAKPPYRMVFEAKISLLEMTQGNDGSGDQTLTRMIHNGNNKPYLDRIYFARAERALQSGKKEQAIADFRTSVAASADNNSQRAASSLALARLYFEESNYRMASCYYDTALSVIDPGYPDYETIVSRTNGLLSLVRNLDVVGREDSLQRIAALPEKERTDYIGKLIAKVV